MTRKIADVRKYIIFTKWSSTNGKTDIGRVFEEI